MVAIRSFMDTDARGQLGGIECGPQVRKKMAAESGAYKCAVCGRSNADIIKEREEAAQLIEAREGKKKEEEVPEELRLAYRDELEKGGSSTPDQDKAEKEPKGKGKVQNPPAAAATVTSRPSNAPTSAPALRPTRTVQPAPAQQSAPQTSEPPLAWVDACIYGLVVALIYMMLRKFS